MAFTTPPYSAYLNVVLTAMKAIALSPAMATEIAAYKTYLTATQPFNIKIRDAAGALANVNVAPSDGVNLTYIADQVAAVSTAQYQKVSPPFPLLQFVGQPGRLQQSTSGAAFRDEGVEGDVYTVDVVVFAATSDDPMRSQEEAIVLAQSYRSLIRRNEQLNGLVQVIQPAGPTQPLGQVPPALASTTVSTARTRFEVYSLVF